MTSDQISHHPAPILSPAAGRAHQAETDALGDAIAELTARIQAATYELLVMIREFDEREGWGAGFASCAHWLNWRTGLALGAAREKVRVARALADLPKLSATMRRGAVSYSKVRAITRVATPETEERLLDFALAGTAAHVERLVRAWRRVDRLADAEDDRRQHAGRHLHTYLDEDGMLVVRGRLTPEAGAVLQRALEAAEDRLLREAPDSSTQPGRLPVGTTETQAEGPEPENAASLSKGRRRADALALVAESALTADLDRGTAGDRYQVVVHVDADALQTGDERGQSALDDGLHVSAGTSRRLACDASKVVMRHDASGEVLDVGRKTRTIPPPIRRALDARDQRCRFPGCESRRCDAHHLRHWADGGATRLDNLVLLCRRHHRAVHEEGFGIELLGNGQVVVRHPAGWSLPDAPSAPTWSGPPLGPTKARLEIEGLVIDGDTPTPSWQGERLDLDWAMLVLHPRQ